MQVSDPSVPFNPNPSGPSEIHVCAVHVQILTEFKCQVRMTAPEMRAQVCPLPLLVDAETKFRGAEVRMQIIWQQDAGSLRCSRLKLSNNTKPAASVNWAGCVLGWLSVCTRKSTKVVREFWRLPETARSIVHHFPLLFLPPWHATIYTLRIIQVFLLAVGCDWFIGPNMAESDWLTARERSELWRQTAAESRQADNRCFLVLWDNVHLEYDSDYKRVFLSYIILCAYDSVLKVEVCFMI